MQTVIQNGRKLIRSKDQYGNKVVVDCGTVKRNQKADELQNFLLSQIAKEVNTIMGLEPPIKSDGSLSNEELISLLTEAAEFLQLDDDEFSTITRVTLRNLLFRSKSNASKSV